MIYCPPPPGAPDPVGCELEPLAELCPPFPGPAFVLGEVLRGSM